MALKERYILDHTLCDEDRAALFRLAGEVRELLGDRLDRIVLFGSRARGDVHEESDIDVLVLTRDKLPVELRKRLSWTATDIQVETPTYPPFSLVVISGDHFDLLRQRERLFALDVEREGIDL